MYSCRVTVGSSRQEIPFDLGCAQFDIRQYSTPVILRERMLPDGFGPVSPYFTVGGVIDDLSEPQLTSCGTKMHLQMIDH
ncbi:unnamed protein product [Schistosoma margrebowiei]|uniref:Uncharacterized protein n=1 Tax=Schistosoma margrebowiei TaxID=48269 RepID=A0A183LMQ9_9TREM|nr:unnamed protein product [Schistosoma margrebowiei]